MRWTDDICKHMVSKTFSLPQLMLKSYLEQIFGEKCSYNDRSILKPYEIDCYFPKFRIGWEYNGIRFHQNNKNDSIKKELAREKGIKLLYINETKKVKKYDIFIKSILKTQLIYINEILEKNIDEKYIDNLIAYIEYPNLLTREEIKIVNGKTINQIKKIDLKLYNRIIYYNLLDKYNIKDDRRDMHCFDNFESYIEYIKSKNYSSFKEAYTKQHIHRMCKKFGRSLEEIKNIYNEKK